MTTGERIKKRRLELGLTQEELAKRLGNKTRASVCTVEKDKEDLTTARIRQYADALRCSPAYLMGWQDDPVDYFSPKDDKTKAIMDILNNLSTEIVDDTELLAQVTEFITIFLSLSPEVRSAFLQTLRGLKS